MKKILGEEPEMKKQDKLDLVLESLNKNLEKIATNIGGKGPPGVMLRKVNGEHITSQHGYQKDIPKKVDAYGRPVPPPAVPIPRHLLPVTLGGTYEDPEITKLRKERELFKKQMDKNVKKNMLAPIKKLYKPEEYVNEYEKQQDNAKFLRRLFDDDVKKDTEKYYNDIQEKVYDEETQKFDSKRLKNDFLKQLNLPKFNEEENPVEERKRMFKDDKLGEEERMRLLAEKRKREEALNNMRKFETIEEDDSEKKKGVRLFIGWTRMLAVFKGIYSEVVDDQKRRRSEQM